MLLQLRAYTVAKAIIEGLDTRFNNLSLLDAFCIFDPGFYIGMDGADLDALFTAEFALLKSHYCGTGFFDPPTMEGKLDEEFSNFKVWMSEIVNRCPSISTRGCLLQIIRAHEFDMPGVLLLLFVSFIIATQTAVVERGFSLHRVFKHRLANRLKILTMDSLMRVKLARPTEPTYVAGK